MKKSLKIKLKFCNKNYEGKIKKIENLDDLVKSLKNVNTSTHT